MIVFPLDTAGKLGYNSKHHVSPEVVSQVPHPEVHQMLQQKRLAARRSQRLVQSLHENHLCALSRSEKRTESPIPSRSQARSTHALQRRHTKVRMLWDCVSGVSCTRPHLRGRDKAEKRSRRSHLRLGQETQLSSRVSGSLSQLQSSVRCIWILPS